MSKILKHLYLASLKNLLYVTIEQNCLYRLYSTEESVKLSAHPNNLDLDNYRTGKDDLDLIVKSNFIRPNNTFSNAVTRNYSVLREENVSYVKHEQMLFLRQPSYQKPKSSNFIFCETLLKAPFSFACRSMNLRLLTFNPGSVEMHRSLFDLKWKSFHIFREQNCLRILGLEPQSLQYKKWSFPLIYPNILESVIIPDEGRVIRE
jgi:hypothetical protein